MDVVKQMIEERKSVTQQVGRWKFFNKLEMEQKLLQTRRQEEKREAEAKNLRKTQLQQQQMKNDTSKLLNSKTDIQCLIKPESSPSALLPQEEVIRRLRFLKHPVTLFGEDEDARFDRLNVVLKAGLFEVEDSDMTEGQTNDFLRDVLELKKSRMLKRKATDQDKDRDDEDLKRMKTNFEDLCDEDKILVFYKKLLNEWNQELDKMSPEAKNQKMVATFMQCARELNPLFNLCRKRLLNDDIRQALVVMVECCMNREYSAAMDQYLNKIAIGNAPWPIGVTMVGIHERSAREKIHANSVAHVMNDETTRKLLYSVKRLVTFRQQRYPTMPSKSVEFNSLANGSDLHSVRAQESTPQTSEERLPIMPMPAQGTSIV
ncbi:pre-mRNA-splicing factor 18-like [Solanum tuberosum]|uniref:Potassium channel regulatory factor n=1 Tax=Solanum tuberosum TaxID=4113 RepID=M1APR2_SOLTU|nr:PREDICTED: pre-mRNA-splicing factor 18-like [Solanum tuberosum]